MITATELSKQLELRESEFKAQCQELDRIRYEAFIKPFLDHVEKHLFKLNQEKENIMSRFDYVKYDNKAAADQQKFKELVTYVEMHIDSNLKSPRAKALALTKLEECYMWIGKAIRDDQLDRNVNTELQEERNNS